MFRIPFGLGLLIVGICLGTGALIHHYALYDAPRGDLVVVRLVEELPYFGPFLPQEPTHAIIDRGSRLGELSEQSRGGVDINALLDTIIWPTTTLGLALIALFSNRLRRIIGLAPRLVRTVSAGGIKIELDSDAAKQLQEGLRQSYAELVRSADYEYEVLSNIQQVDAKLAKVLETEKLKQVQGCRGTVHVRDIVDPEFLYQLVDYYPSGGGAHRRKSQRFGIIGRAWRSGKTHFTGDAFNEGETEQALIENWGMTREETKSNLGARPASLSILLCDEEGIPVGVLFVDSTEKDAFGRPGEIDVLVDELAGSRETKALEKSVAAVVAALRGVAPNIRTPRA